MNNSIYDSALNLSNPSPHSSLLKNHTGRLQKIIFSFIMIENRYCTSPRVTLPYTRLSPSNLYLHFLL